MAFVNVNVVAGAVEAMKERGDWGYGEGQAKGGEIGDGSLLRIGGMKHGQDGRKKQGRMTGMGKQRNWEGMRDGKSEQ